MDALVEKLKESIKEWPRNFPRDISKKLFCSYLKEYQETVKYIPKRILECSDDGVHGNDGTVKKNENMDESTSERKTPRVQKIEELREKIKAVKGKTLSEVESLKRKKLKKRLRKKLKLEERMKAKRNKNTSSKPNNSHKVLKMSVKKQKNEDGGDEIKENEVVYSKFDFPEGVDEENTKKKGPRDPLRILQKVEKSRKKLREMEARGRIEKVKEIKEKLAWEAALKKAEGHKVKDDVELLKKSINKKKNIKSRSKKKWEGRENLKVQKMEEAQKKRTTNIQNKKKEKQKKKMKKLIKKGRILPG